MTAGARTLEERERRYEAFKQRVEIPMMVVAFLLIPVLLMPLV